MRAAKAARATFAGGAPVRSVPFTRSCPLIGSNTQGAQAGDRPLSASASEVLCFAVVLPLSTGNASQGLSNTATFTFDAEQTANNP